MKRKELHEAMIYVINRLGDYLDIIQQQYSWIEISHSLLITDSLEGIKDEEYKNPDMVFGKAVNYLHIVEKLPRPKLLH